MTAPYDHTLSHLRETLKHLPSASPAPRPPGESAGSAAIDRLGLDVHGKRVLVVAGEEEPGIHDLYESHGALTSKCEWGSLDAAVADSPKPEFELVHAEALHQAVEPVGSLRRLRSVLAPAAALVLQSMVLDDPERSELLRFVPHAYDGDPRWWFVPGRLALRWMLHRTGFAVRAELLEEEGPRGPFPVRNLYLHAVAEP